MGRRVPKIVPGDWNGVAHAIAKLDHELNTGAEPIFKGIGLTDLTASRLVATDASKVLESADLYAWVTQTANQVLIADDGDGTVTFSLPQNIHTGASPTFAGGTFTGVVTGILPVTGDHFATKEYVDLAIGASFDLFLSNTDDGVVADTHVMYAQETGEAESTEDSAALGQGDDQLAFSWLSEAGVPGTSTLREGIYDVHIHLNRAVGNKPVTIYWKLSYVDADGSSNKTAVVTSETTEELTTSEAMYNIHAVVSMQVTTGVTKRLLLEVYANVGVAGGNAVITATLEGDHNPHLSVQLPSDVWQMQGDVLDDLNTVGQVGANSEFLVGTGAGTFAWESGTTVRTSLGLGTGDTPTFTTLILSTIAAEGSDVDKFLVDSSNTIKFRTGAQVLSDIGAAASGHNHSGVYEPADAGLTSLAGLSYVSDSFIKVTATDTYAIRTIAETKTDLSLNNVTNVATDDTAYNATSWDSNADAATKNAIRDKVETMDTTIGSNTTHRGLTSGNPHSVTPTELSLLIGTNTQAWDAGLDSLAALSYVSASFVKMTGADTFALRTIGETADDLEGTIVHDNLASVHQGVATTDAPTFVGMTSGGIISYAFEEEEDFGTNPIIQIGKFNKFINPVLIYWRVEGVNSNTEGGIALIDIRNDVVIYHALRHNNKAADARGIKFHSYLDGDFRFLFLEWVNRATMGNSNTLFISCFAHTDSGNWDPTDTSGVFGSSAEFGTDPLLFLDGEDGAVGFGTNTPVTRATIEGALTLKEQAAADDDTASYGQVWVKNTNPCELWFTDDTGTDTQIV